MPAPVDFLGQDGHEDLLLEDPHVVRPLDDGRLKVVAAVELATEMGRPAADEQLRALLLADRAVAGDLRVQTWARRIVDGSGGWPWRIYRMRSRRAP